ncbi:MAG: isoprenylcysteine carboxylmethyltransferase family protein [Dehalococcoidia bacterium]|nr:MAG: isoprenylcysteine carboxylmethyltransferase family protein [Dehalococcoidia bacterium]
MSISDRYANFVYRLATGSKKLKAIITLPVTLLFLGLVALFVLASIWVDKRFLFFHFEAYWWTQSLSIIILILGWLICMWAALTFLRNRGTPVPFNPPPKLITTGLYRYIRNPMLLGLFIFLLGLGVLLGSFSLIFIFTPLFVVINVSYLKAIEEKEMEKKFGRQYLEYKKKVPMFFPKL